MGVTKKQEQIIINNYLSGTHPTSFAGIGQLKHFYPDISVKNLQNVLDSIKNYTLYREEKKPRHYNPFYVRYKRHQAQADLMDLQKLAPENNGVKYLLAVIDIFTRYAWIVPLKTKSAKDVNEAFFKHVLKDMKKAPAQLATDEGKEFINNDFLKLMKQHNIKRIVLNNKAPHVERFNRTFLNILNRYRASRENTKRYINLLPSLVRLYNNRYHRMIRMSPAEAEKDSNYDKVLKSLEKYYQKPERHKKPKYKVGDVVRISSFKQTFHKHYRQTFKDTLYVITQVLVKMPVPMYKLAFYESGSPEAGSWYAEELTKVQKPKKGGVLRRSARALHSKNYKE